MAHREKPQKTAEDKRTYRTTPLDQLLRGKLLESAKKRGFSDDRILQDWTSIVGDAVSRRCQPIKIMRSRDGGVLHVAASGAAALELQHLGPQLIDRINSYFGYRAVRKLQIIQAPLPQTPSRKNLKQPLADGKLAETQCVAIAEGPLKSAMVRLHMALQEKKSAKRKVRRITPLCLILSGFLALQACVNADPVFDPPASIEDEDVRRFARLVDEAEAGRLEAQYELGKLYERGRGVPRDLTRAHQWYLAAAQSGYAAAMRPLGDLYHEGIGVGQNDVRAVFWYERALNHGDPVAAYRLANMRLESGDVSEAGAARAIEHLERAANEGYVPAQLDLAKLFEDGQIVEADPARSGQWYAMARISLQGEASDDDATALLRLGDLYRDGLGVDADGVKAAGYYEKSAELGRNSALLRLARLYDRGGANLQPNEQKAASYYARAAEAGEVRAAYDLAKKYVRGAGVEQDGQKALRLFEQVARSGDSRAYRALGELLSDDRLEPTNYLAAIEWFERSAQTGNGKSMFKIAEILEIQAPRPTEPGEVLAWYELARENGYSRARKRIGEIRQTANADLIRNANEIKTRIEDTFDQK